VASSIEGLSVGYQRSNTDAVFSHGKSDGSIELVLQYLGNSTKVGGEALV